MLGGGLQRQSATKASSRLQLSSFRLHSAGVDFAKEMEAKYFDFNLMEEDIYKWWEGEDFFKPPTATSEAPDKKKPFVVSMPPPNVTGYLHMGHAIFVALQDIMCRFQRMRGRPTLWVPGTDHAGIATQLLVERQLTAEGTSRQEIGREAFIDRVWEWKNEKGGYIIQQMRRLGASADWSREKFTLEPQMSEAVTEAFLQLHEKGLIYKGSYLVNWSPNLQTAVSDLEVEYTEEQGKLYYFRYELADGSGDIPVATTRPETILGDTAVCVHPEDTRYQAFIGKEVKVPMSYRTIPVIADDYVDMEFGTGALKITPAHDPNDYAIGKRHNLAVISIMNKDASINDNGGQYMGLDRFACRDKIWSDMETAGLTIKAEPHMQRVPRSQRGGEVIEPMVSTQWFMKMKDMGERAVNSVKNKELVIIPDRFEKVWYNWLDNIHDWCISRQLWWGHQIPVYYATLPGMNTEEQGYVVARSKDDALQMAKEKWGTETVSLRQDDDVLDTWFSSGLWPFATVGWGSDQSPEATSALSDYSRFYPSSVMETGYDILFFWVARMVMMGQELTDKLPFHTVYLHGLVRDGQGKKMSKTTGNVIDPIQTVDKFGSDALRYSLVTGCTPGQDIPLSMEKIEANRNFVNKLWNMGKYIQTTLAGLTEAEKHAYAGANSAITAEELSTLPLPERYVISKCHLLAQKVTEALESHSFGEAGLQIYQFLWDEFADWYIEASKPRMRGSDDIKHSTRRVILHVWGTCLRLLHPYMPFITETLFQHTPHTGSSIMVSDWPVMEGDAALPVDTQAIAEFESIQELVRIIRNARAEYKVDPGKKIGLGLVISSKSKLWLAHQVETEKEVVSLLARLDLGSTWIVDKTNDELGPETAIPEGTGECVHISVEEGVDLYLPQSGLIDKKKEADRLQKQAEKLGQEIQLLEKRLGNEGYVAKAPPALVTEVRGKLAGYQEQLKTVEASLLTLQ